MWLGKADKTTMERKMKSMKKCFLCLLAMALALLAGSSALAADKIAALPANLTAIEAEAFAGTDFARVDVPEGVTDIGAGAFAGSASLARVTLPQGIQRIGDGAFSDCPKLDIFCYSGVAENYCRANNLRYRLIDAGSPREDFTWREYDSSQTAEITGYAGSDTEIVLPAVSPTGYAVKGAYNIKDSETLRAITVSNGIERLSSMDNLTALEELNLPGTLTQMSGLQNATSLTTLTLPDSLSETGVFKGCTALRTVRLPANLTAVGSSAFEGCAVLQAPVLPASVTRIGAYAFKNCAAIDHIDVPAGLREIGTQAFAGAGIAEIDLPDNITKVGEGAFSATCKRKFSARDTATANALSDAGISFTTHDDPDFLFRYNTGSGNNGFEDMDFYTGEKVLMLYGYIGDAETVAIPEGVVYIAYDAFRGNEIIREVTFPSTCLAVGSSFGSAAALETVHFNQGLGLIGYHAFYGCAALKAVDIPGSVQHVSYAAFSNCAALERVSFEDGCTLIGSSAFSSCAALTQLTLPGTLKEIGSGAFAGCSALPTVDFPEGLETIKGSAFSTCKSLGVLTIPAGVHELDNVFPGCTFDTIYLPDGITAIKNLPSNCVAVCGRDSATAHALGSDNPGYASSFTCPGQEDFVYRYTIPNLNDSTIGETYGNGLTLYKYRGSDAQVQIPDGVLYISGEAFSRNETLEEVVIPSCCRGLGDSIFLGCPALRQVTIAEGVENIGSHDFAYCSSLERIDIPGSVRCIYYAAFAECTGLESANIGEGVVTVGESAFSKCTALTQATLPGTLKEIGSNAFASCVALPTVDFPEGLETIRDGAFNECYSLGVLTIPEGIHELKAFRGCNFDTIYLPDHITTEINHGSLPEHCVPVVSDWDCDTAHSLATNGGNPYYSHGFTVPGMEDYVFAYLDFTIIHMYRTESSWGSYSAYENNGQQLTLWKYRGHDAHVNIPEGVVYVDNAFVDNLALQSVHIPASVRALWDSFSGCLSLQTATFEEGTELIGYCAFRNAPLPKVTLPTTVNKICSYAIHIDGQNPPAREAVLRGAVSIDSSAFDEHVTVTLE